MFDAYARYDGAICDACAVGSSIRRRQRVRASEALRAAVFAQQRRYSDERYAGVMRRVPRAQKRAMAAYSSAYGCAAI